MKKEKETIVKVEVEKTTQKQKKEKVDLLQLQIDTLSKNVKELQIEYDKIHHQYTDLANNTKIIKKSISTIDTLFADITTRYGFNGEFMYYIGAGSGHIYKKPINDHIIDLIQRIQELNWEDIQKINQHFMEK